ncbi:hypothetical protein QBC34DRAFT_27831 [Podospora aff. communis PSN243]|uniref:DUF7735 domain-containing protein n=1 Tax=Podospora aff. communis PSN243 TaxID=3040156 RepID=A0AAV9GXG8_9PEZI|nr:hypothetical protein QBC34DRAFT_27831 [Podospora aff. communis PSN243]
MKTTTSLLTTTLLLLSPVLATRAGTPQTAGWQDDLPAEPTSCARSTITRFLDVPQPTGALHAALTSFAPDLLSACTGTDPTNLEGIDCLYHPRDRLCRFTKSAPANLVKAYSAYLDNAIPWLEERYADAGEVYTLERMCRVEWVAGHNERAEGQVGFYDLWMMSYCREMELWEKGRATATVTESGEGGKTVGVAAVATGTGSETGVEMVSKITASFKWDISADAGVARETGVVGSGAGKRGVGMGVVVVMVVGVVGALL